MRKTDSSVPAHGRPLMLTSSQAAGLLEVHESSIKRWTNLGSIRQDKTEGGHRRIPLDDLLAFARKERTEAALLRFPSYERQMAEAALACRELNNFQPLVDLIVELCDHKPHRYLVDVLKYLRSAFNIPLTRSFEMGVVEALRRIGREWADGTRSIAQEHRFTQKVMDALYGLRQETSDYPGEDAPLALVGSAESCHHEIGAMFVRIILEEAGWQVCYLGSNVPFSEVAGIQSETRARLVAISFVPPASGGDARRCLSVLAGLYRKETPYYLALGGGGLRSDGLALHAQPFLGVKVEQYTEAFQSWAKTRLKEKHPQKKERK